MEKEETIKMKLEKELEIFKEAQKSLNEAEKQIGVLSADIARHIALKNEIGRTNEHQSMLSLESIKSIIDELKKANDTLLCVLLKSGEE